MHDIDTLPSQPTMAPPKSAIDNADNIQKFIAQMKPSNGNGNNPWSSVKGPAQQNGLTAANGDEDELTRVTQPMGIPVRAAGTANSPETHPIPSPHASGLLAPQNVRLFGELPPLSLLFAELRHLASVPAEAYPWNMPCGSELTSQR